MATVNMHEVITYVGIHPIPLGDLYAVCFECDNWFPILGFPIYSNSGDALTQFKKTILKPSDVRCSCCGFGAKVFTGCATEPDYIFPPNYSFYAMTSTNPRTIKTNSSTGRKSNRNNRNV